MKIKEKYKKENFEKIIRESYTLTEVAEKLGVRFNKSYNHKTIIKYIKLYDLDILHFLTPKERIKRFNPAINNKIPTIEILIENSTYDRGNLKKRLYKEGLKSRKCELCGQGEIWNGKKMSLILDHKNGVNNDNRLENLQIVCPNCNATLDTHCGKNVKKNINNKIKPKVDEIVKRKNIHEGKLKARKVQRPPYEDLKKEVWSNGFSATGRKYGVSDNAIRKWIKYYENYELKLKE